MRLQRRRLLVTRLVCDWRNQLLSNRATLNDADVCDDDDDDDDADDDDDDDDDDALAGHHNRWGNEPYSDLELAAIIHYSNPPNMAQNWKLEIGIERMIVTVASAEPPGQPPWPRRQWRIFASGAAVFWLSILHRNGVAASRWLKVAQGHPEDIAAQHLHIVSALIFSLSL